MKNYLLPLLLLFSLHGISGGNEPVDTVPPHQISILTWNIKMLPRGATFLHHHPIKRARIIPGILIKESPDVIVFQESYDGKAMRMIRKKLKPMYPHHQGFQNKKAITYKRAGGVIMFSKYPVKELESIKYSELRGIDKPAAKGALLIEVEHPVKKFQVFGTHMQAGYGPQIKMSQYKDAGALLKRHRKEGVPQFAAGDFNTRRTDTLLYPKLLSELEMEDGDICTELKCTSDHLLNDMDSYEPAKRNLIDYVFFKPNGAPASKVNRSVMSYEQQWHKNHRDLSDHYAVLLKMDF